MSDLKTILFIGKDEKYWSSLQEKFQKNSKDQKFNFKIIYKKEDSLFQNLIIDIKEIDPQVIFIDYTTDPGKLMTLARLIRRCFPRLKSIIGLWDYLAEHKFIRESNISGVYINHIKSGEFDDVIYHAEMLSSEDKKDLPKVAEAPIPIEYPMSLATLMKVGYITPNIIHIEHNFDFDKGRDIQLQTYFGKYFNLKNFKVKEVLNKDLYYAFQKCHDLEIVYEDELGDEIDQETGEPVVKVRAEIIENRYKEWFDKEYRPTNGCKERVLIIDPSLQCLEQAQSALDTYPNSLRFNSDINYDSSIIEEVLPRLIVYHFKVKHVEPRPEAEEEGQEEAMVEETPAEEDENTVPELYGADALNLIVQNINKIQGYEPFILVFNAKQSSEELKQTFKYEKMIGDSEGFNFDKVLKLGSVLNNKCETEKSQAQENEETIDNRKLLIDKVSPESNVEYVIDCQLNLVSESYISFTSSEKIPMNTVFEMKKPVNMYVTVMPKGEEDYSAVEGGFQYFAVNHGLTEESRATLRRFVNEMIYLPKQLEKDAERAEFEAKKVEFKKKEEEDKVKAAEEAKKKAEEEAKKKEEERLAKEAAAQQAKEESPSKE